MKDKPKTSRFDELAKDDPELAEILAEIRQKKEAGIIRDAPKTYRDCKDWRDAWLYAFMRAKLHPDRHMRLNGDAVLCVAWIGPAFNDKIVAALEKTAPLLGENRDLRELRLIATAVTGDGMERLKALFPKAAITVHSWEDDRREPSLSNVREM
ncbi:hypothetical protein CfE428DRAFT_5512 [Chthoniobacter flavus Ellin428]|uniref:Uncharacterized protein n=1 Tax=Chthoniobacter flavus Ellin428 TaxID=497964 RepID=B4D9C2_9BACT|nr:hypothetical protein [Chthoniobacter flavus]EDY16883.1 hypothetical protein CfE428DRAFT_5512 [Chthoniobacter flavus Ellin428]TCO87765.1 hypothetical protein EV701_12064 [Chthoniobacter flavus]